MSTLAIVGIDVILLIVLLMLSVAALLLRRCTDVYGSGGQCIYEKYDAVGIFPVHRYGSSCKSAFHHRWNLYGRQWCCKETA